MDVAVSVPTRNITHPSGTTTAELCPAEIFEAVLPG
jgi:hypothetical protein